MKSIPFFCVGLLASTSCWADQRPVLVGDHRDFGRVVITLDSPAPVTVKQKDRRVNITVPGADDVTPPDIVPRNVLSITASQGKASLEVLSGARVKTMQEGNLLIIDVFDPAIRGRDATTASSRPNPGKLVAVSAENPAAQNQAGESKTEAKAEPAMGARKAPAPAVQEAALPPVSERSKPVPTGEAAVPPTVPRREAGVLATVGEPAAPIASVLPLPAIDVPANGPDQPFPTRPVARSFVVLAGSEVGAAAFRRGRLGIVVFDDPVTLADADDDPTTWTPTLRSIQRGTLATVPLAEGESLAMTRSADSIEVTIASPTGSPAVQTAVPTGIQFQVAKLGRVMAVSDPVSGQTMLVGTSRQANGDHAMVATARSAPGYVMLPTWVGIAVETTSDQIDLRASMSSYTLSIADKASTNATAAVKQENQFNIPIAPPAVLVRQLNAQIASAAAAPPRGRGPERVAAARTMLALGMSAESQAILTLAATDDPVIARDPDAAALTGIAAVLAGRPGDASGLDNPALPTGGDMALWRGLRDVSEGKQAPALAGAWPLLSAYPDAVRQQITPPVMEAAAMNGADVPAAEMEGGSLALARALKLGHDGKTDAAIDALAAIKNGRDERMSVRAGVELAELKLRAGLSTPLDAAEQLEQQTVRWRGGVQELSLRLRVADLLSQGGKWRQALEGLRDTQNFFPDSGPDVAAAKANVFRSLLSPNAPVVPPLEMVLIAGEFADSLPDGEDGDRLAGLLADKLAALDLPSRAISVLKTMIEKTPSPVAKAEYGMRLAQMEIEAGDPAAAEKHLAALDLANLPPARDEQRTMLIARAKAARGDFIGGAMSLLTLSTSEADDLRATYYAKAGDWQRSLDTLEGIVATSIPETGDLDAKQQDLILREATAAVQAGNADALKRVARFERRITPPRADLFRVLTATAVRSPDDLPRAARELAMSKTLPDRLNALKLR